MDYTDEITQKATLKAVKIAADENFPNLWPFLECAMSVVATLKLRDIAGCPCLIFQGPPSSLKTIALTCISWGQFYVYESDRFTPSSFVSSFAAASEERLKEIDMLPKIKNKALITPELAPTFRGREEKITENLAVVTRILDGQGLQVDSGTHGRRGYAGDYRFVWLGATTLLRPSTWDIISTIGSRLFFLSTGTSTPSDAELDSVISGGRSFSRKIKDCQFIVNDALSLILPDESALRGMDWTAEKTSKVHTEAIRKLSQLVSVLRAVLPDIGDKRSDAEFGQAQVEFPYRAISSLFDFARGRAVLYGRDYLVDEDVAMLVPIALSSGPQHRGLLFQAAIRQGGSVKVLEAAEHLKVTKEPARRYLDEVTALGLFEERTAAGTDIYVLRDEWGWFLSSEFRRLLELSNW